MQRFERYWNGGLYEGLISGSHLLVEYLVSLPFCSDLKVCVDNAFAAMGGRVQSSTR